MIILQLCQHSENSDATNLEVSINTSFPDERFQVFPVRANVSIRPLKLMWQSNLRISKNLAFIKIPGKLEIMNIRNSAPMTESINLFWVQPTQNLGMQFQDAILKCNMETFCSHYHQYSSQEMMRNLVLKSNMDYRAVRAAQTNKFLQPDKFYPNPHKCGYEDSLYHDVHVTEINSCLPSQKHVQLGKGTGKNGIYQKFQRSHFFEHTHTCSVRIHCIQYEPNMNHTLVNYFTFHYLFGGVVVAQASCWQPPTVRKSWLQASMLCRSAGGHLPAFRSNKELTGFLKVLQFGLRLPPIEMVYMGFILNERVIRFHFNFVKKGRLKKTN